MNHTAFTSKYKGLSNVLSNEVAVVNPTNGASIKINAVWDTGAQSTCVTKKVVDALNLVQTGVQPISTPSGDDIVPRYNLSLLLPNKVKISPFPANMVKLNKADMLIGMDIINLGDFAVSNYESKTTFTFRYPSIAETDYVQLINNSKPITKHKYERNEPCFCGSGKKYKNCHGK